MTSRVDRLKEYVEAAAGRDVVIGVDDCAPWVLKWVALELGTKATFPDYVTREAGYEILEAHGGLVKMADACLSVMRVFPAIVQPEPGDVGVMRLADREVAVIFVPGGNVVSRRDDSGIKFMPARQIVKAWALG